MVRSSLGCFHILLYVMIYLYVKYTLFKNSLFVSSEGLNGHEYEDYSSEV